MKLLKNVLLLISGAIVVFAIAVLLYARFTLTPQNIRETFAAEVSYYLRRNISCKDITVSWLGSIVLKDVILHKSFPWEEHDILTCSEIYLQARLIPLLLGKLFIKEVLIQEPRIALFQQELGQYLTLYGDITQRRTTASSSQQPPLRMIFLPTNLEIRNGSFVLTSTIRELPQPIRISLADLNMLVSNVSPLFSFPFTLSARVVGPQLSLLSCSGELSVPRQKMTATLSLEPTDLSLFKEYFAFYRVPVKSGTVKLGAQIDVAALKDFSVNGSLDLQDVEIGVASFMHNGVTHEVALQGANATLHFAAVWNIPGELITFQKLEGSVLSASYSGEGTIKNVGTAPYVQLTFKADDFPLENFFNRLSAKLPWMLDEASLSGKADLRLNLEGELPHKVFTKFTVNFKGNRLHYKPLGGFQPDIEGAGMIDNNKIGLRDLKIGIKNSTITLAGDIVNYLGENPQPEIKIVASHVNMADFMVSGTNPEDAEKEEVGPFDFKGLTLGGPIDLGSVAFLGIFINNLRGSYLLADNLLSIKELTGTIGQGQFKLEGTVNLGVKGLDYSVNLNLDRASCKEISKIINPLYENFVDGMISGTGTMKGNGVTPLRLVKNLEGRGFFTVQDALFKGVSLGTIGSLLRMDGRDGLRFDQGQLQLKLAHSIVDISGGFINPDLAIYPNGTISFDSSLSLDTILKLSPAFSRRMMSEKVLQYFPQEDGWIVLPIEVRGTIYEPRISLSKEVLNIFIEKVMPAVLNEMLKERQGQGGAAE